jgi:hypothetical protein
VAGNTTGQPGSGLLCRDETQLTVWNSIFWENTPSRIPEIVVENVDGPSALIFDFSLIQGDRESLALDPASTVMWGEHMVKGDPLFVDPAASDYHILPNSPCRNKGSNNAASCYELYRDLDGESRRIEGITDVGADEFNPY